MRLYNSATRKKEEFIPLELNQIKMYVCGPTVYNYFHIGNARPFVVFDSARRFFEYLGYQVQFVQNFTDIDDKMIKKANEEGITVKELGDRFIEEYKKDAQGLGVKPATHHPRATEMIGPMIKMVKTLVEKGHAYAANGSVYFSIDSFPEYGKLIQQDLEDLKAGARIEGEEGKKNPLDFVLWKSAKPGEPSWNSPWGQGRPGWHLECSAMIKQLLGDTIDIHAGGADLQFPHHTNEIAQSEAANGKPFARYWLHNGFINVNNEKMSKSLNNFFTVRDIAKTYDYEIIRFFLLSVHYRSPINFSDESMEHAKAGLERIKTAVKNANHIARNAKVKEMSTEEIQKAKEITDQFKEKFISVMEDDLNTADAISVIFELVRVMNTEVNASSSASFANEMVGLIKELSQVLGLLQKDEEEEVEPEIKELIEKRQQARKDKNWAMADQIRDELKSKGYVLEDTPQGIRVHRI